MTENIVRFLLAERRMNRERRKAAKVADIDIGPNLKMAIFAFADMDELVEVRYCGEVLHLTAGQAAQIGAALKQAAVRARGGSVP